MIIGDSSALVSLAVMDCLHLLEMIFDEVYVPKAVYDELVIENKPQSGQLKRYLSGRVQHVESEIEKTGLGKGELEAIALYRQMEADFLLIDDKRARDFARLNGVHIIGSLGVLLLAYDKGLITSVEPFLQKLKDSNIYVSEKLLHKVMNIIKQKKS